MLAGGAKNKALGADGWSFGELVALVLSGLDKLGEFYGLVEDAAFPSFLAGSSPRRAKEEAKDAGRLPVLGGPPEARYKRLAGEPPAGW